MHPGTQGMPQNHDRTWNRILPSNPSKSTYDKIYGEELDELQNKINRLEAERIINDNLNGVTGVKLSPEQIDMIIYSINKYAQSCDRRMYGVPIHGEHIKNLRDIVISIIK